MNKVQNDFYDIWIDPRILNGEEYYGGGLLRTAHDWINAHKIWTHAEKLILAAKSDEDLIDGMVTLNRAIAHRLSRLNSTYKLRHVKYPGKPKGFLDQLEFFGMVKPAMVKQIASIRNSVTVHSPFVKIVLKWGNTEGMSRRI
jgi:hypothetical protein